MSPHVPLTPEELGITLDEDTPDFEPVDSIPTETRAEFETKVTSWLKGSTGRVGVTLLRKTGILYCRVEVEGDTALFTLPWLQGPDEHRPRLLP